MTQDQKRKLEQQLWNIADELRGKMNADGFRDYCLGFIFYKYLSERITEHANNILKDSGESICFTELNEDDEEHQEYLEALQEETLNQLGYFLKPNELFHHIAERGSERGEKPREFILEDLTKVLRNIERSTMGTDSEEDFEHLFEDLDLTSTKLGKTEKAKNELIAKILEHLDKIDFAIHDSNSDVLGDAYEYLIGQFASGAGKKAGEFYTPQSVSTVLSSLVTVDKTHIKSVYDPTCGSGSLLLRVARETQVEDFYGQEMNRTTFNLARMNMILHGVHYRNFNLKQDDTLEHPQHLDHRFEAIVANPPFSAKWSSKASFSSDDRFSQYGKLAPASKADFAFVQHMIYQLADNGTMAIVLPHGVLFRGAAEGSIREHLIKELNYLDAVIGLPANIFYGTSIPTCILVFKKCRNNPDDILFIDASNEFERGKNQNNLSSDNIKKILSRYQARKTEKKYCYLAPLSEVAENGYNLNIPRYVDTFEEEEPIDLVDITKQLKDLDRAMIDTDSSIANYCKELEIESPFEVIA